jgi:hypothetical protein
MGRIHLIALVVLVLVGCGRKGPPPAAAGGGGPVGPVLAPAETPGWEAPRGAGPIYQGRAAPQWGEQLQAPDPVRRAEAAMALGKLGQAGYPFLMANIKQGSDDARLVSLQAMAKQELVGNQRETMPLLVNMLGARTPALRQAAACRLAWYGLDSQQALQQLQRLADSDSDPEVRRVAAAAIAEIDEFVTTGSKSPRGKPSRQ